MFLFIDQHSVAFEFWKHQEVFVGGKLQGAVAISLEADWKFHLRDFIDDFDVFFVLLGAVEVFSRVNGFEIIHELVDELCNRNFRQIAMSFVSNQPHRENVAQRRGDQMWIFADEQLEVSSESLYAFW